MSKLNQMSNYPAKAVDWDEFIKLTEVSPEHLNEIIALGWISVRPADNNPKAFLASDIYRVRKLERICGDFELPVIGGTIIVDLLDRIDRLELLVRRFNKLEQE